ncbi:MAG: TonB-dependent receptor [Bacteroidales bacterium]|nr:TonB-dependent receptor [Bacteroidales bacterium]
MLFRNRRLYRTEMTAALMLLHIAGLSAPVVSDSIFIEGHIDEVTVASVKTNKHDLTPASVSLIGPAILRTQQLTEVSELSGVLPNFYIPEYGSKQTTPIAIRGIMSKVKSTAVGFYVDGMPHFEVSSFDSDMLDVKAIEVFRGPQGTLYGRNTLGGVINIYTYSPFEHQGTKIRVGYGNYSNINAQLSNYTRINNKFGLSAGGYFKHKGGFYTNEYLGKKADKSNEAGGKLGLYWRLSRKINMRLTSNYDYVNQGGYPYAPYDTERKECGTISYNRECGFSRNMSTNGFNINYSGNGLSINSQTTMQFVDEHVSMDQDYSAEDKYFITLDIGQRAISEELTIKTDNNSRMQWVGGLFFFHQKRDYLSDTEYIKQAYHSVNDYVMPTTGFAAYAQLSYNIVGGLSATAGLRFDYEKSEDDYCSYKKEGDTKTIKSDFDSELATTDLMPKFGLKYKWNGRNVAFANITRGCKAGGFNTVFEKEEERTYDDEYNWNYEAGIKMASENKKIGGELTLFYIDWKKQHISRTLPGIGNVIYNAGHSDSKGIEASITAKPIVGLLLQGNYGYTFARFIEYKKSDTQDYSDNMIPMVPRNTITMLASYSMVPRKELDLVTVSMNMNGVGKLYWLEDNKVEQPFYLQAGAKIAIEKSIATLELWAKNMTNTKYLSYYFMSSAPFAQKGQPATFGATLNIKI